MSKNKSLLTYITQNLDKPSKPKTFVNNKAMASGWLDNYEEQPVFSELTDDCKYGGGLPSFQKGGQRITLITPDGKKIDTTTDSQFYREHYSAGYVGKKNADGTYPLTEMVYKGSNLPNITVTPNPDYLRARNAARLFQVGSEEDFNSKEQSAVPSWYRGSRLYNPDKDKQDRKTAYNNAIRLATYQNLVDRFPQQENESHVQYLYRMEKMFPGIVENSRALNMTEPFEPSHAAKLKQWGTKVAKTMNPMMLPFRDLPAADLTPEEARNVGYMQPFDTADEIVYKEVIKPTLNLGDAAAAGIRTMEKNRYKSRYLGPKPEDLMITSIINPLYWEGAAMGKVGSKLPYRQMLNNLKLQMGETSRLLHDEFVYPLRYKKEINELKKMHANAPSRFSDPEVIERLKVMGIDPQRMQYPTMAFKPGPNSWFNSWDNHINIDFNQIKRLKNEGNLLDAKTVYEHEMGHWLQKENHIQSKEYKEALKNYLKELQKHNTKISSAADPEKAALTLPKPQLPMPEARRTIIDEHLLDTYDVEPVTRELGKKVNKIPQSEKNARYFAYNVEAMPHLREMRQNMLNDGYISNYYQPIGKDIIQKYITDRPQNRIASFTPDDPDIYDRLSLLMHNLPSVVPAAATVGAAGAIAADQKKRGGLVMAQDGKEYTGPSIVDYLSTKGYKGDKAFRKKLAEQYGVENYDFSAKKNLELLAKLKENDDMLEAYEQTMKPLSLEHLNQMLGANEAVPVPASNIASPAPVNQPSPALPVTRKQTKQPAKVNPALIALQTGYNPFVQSYAPTLNVSRPAIPSGFSGRTQPVSVKGKPAPAVNQSKGWSMATAPIPGADENANYGSAWLGTKKLGDLPAGVRRTTAKEAAQTLEKSIELPWYDELATDILSFFSDDLAEKYKNKTVRSIAQVNPQERKSTLDLSNINFDPVYLTGDTIPDGKRRYHIPEVMDLDYMRFGVRNRGDYRDIETEGAPITTFEPFKNSKQYFATSKDPANATYIGVAPDGRIKVGTKDVFQDQEYQVTRTFGNKVVDFNRDATGNIIKVPSNPKASKETLSPSVKVLGDDGKLIDGKLSLLLPRTGNQEESFDLVTGGRYIFQTPDGKTKLVSGSLKNIEAEFTRMKKDNPYVNVITLDNGSYSRGIRTFDQKLTKQDLKGYDNQNTGGGNIAYILPGARKTRYEAKFTDFETAAKKRLQSYFPGKNVSVGFQNTDLYDETGGRDIESQIAIQKKGNSQTPVSLHNFNAAKDYILYVDGKPLDANANKNLYKDILWKAADETGLYHLEDWDPTHISLVKEGQKTGFDELFQKYPDLFQHPNFVRSLNYIDKNRSNPAYQEYYELLHNIQPFTGQPRTTEYMRSKMAKKAKGGAILDPMGQWAHPGKDTIIPSGNITMEGVPYPVYGVDNTGYAQMMYPGMQYEFPGNMVYEIPVMGKGGYTVTRSSERKGKTHKVTGPDGTVKFFGDSKMGQHPDDPERKKAFYARHKKNLDKNPYFRAFARATWAEGGETNNDREMIEGVADILRKVKDSKNRKEIASYMMDNFREEEVQFMPEQFLQMANVFKQGGQMIRRADGSYSQRGLWDNIRANKGSGKKPTKEMLEQERKIKAEEKKYGGQTNWLEKYN